MKKAVNFIFSVMFCMILTITNPGFLFSQTESPKAEKSSVTDDYFGTTIADPYRWMEESSPKLEAWIEAENRLTNTYLQTIPFRDALRQKITDTINYPKHSLPWTKKGRLFYSKNDGLQNQSVLYVVDSPESQPRVLLDPNTLSDDGTVSLQRVAVSGDGAWLAYSLARSGSDWNEIHVLNIETGEKLADHVQWVKFSSIAWHGDGFYYSCYDAPKEGKVLTAKNEFQKIYFHRLGTDQTEDLLILEDREHPQRTHSASTDRDEQYLFISEGDSTYGNSLKFKKLDDSDQPFKEIVSDFDSEQDVVTVMGDKFYLLTDRNASNKRLVKADPQNPSPEHWEDVIPESDSLLQSVYCLGGKFVATYLKDAASAASVYSLKGEFIREITLPTLGVCGFSGEKDQSVFYQSFTSFTYPTVIYQCDIETGESKEFFPAAIEIPQENYVTERVRYTNSDGKKVPIFLVYRKGLKKDGTNPTLLYGYGGFNISMTPSFSSNRLPFIENGGIYAVAILRGGGEYGETWHKSGTKLRKQNVFDDFIAAAEFLIDQKYTSPKKLAIQGGSNGGLLVGAALTQRPELFQAAIPAVGVLDMLRYHKFTIGWAWALDYGTSEESREMFEYLLSYSPLHNVKSGMDYPAIFVTTSDHDDRVVPAHSFKFVATLQEKSTGANPIFIRIETKAGHGAGKPISKVIDESTDVWAFIMDQLGMEFKP